MMVWMQPIEENRLEALLYDLERMPGFMYLHLLDAREDPQQLILIYWQDECSMLTWHNLVAVEGTASTYSLQRSLGPDVI